MIAYVEGRLAESMEHSCVVVTEGGVGYEVYLPAHTLSHLPPKGDACFFYVCTVVREDALELFGFSTWEERQTFIVLTAINRVGARTALAILSVFRPEDLRRIVLEENVQLLTRVPGIGKKTAQQLFLELKYKLKLDGPTSQVAAHASGKVLQDVVAGLVNLGYDEDDALHVARQALEAQPDLELGGALRAALKILAGGR